ncbi:S-layer homology domain-containing protein [Paenibacillus sp. GCM10027627]|uniref:S-layer homology domain-containing protein n=1 Tax=unclassified Paenibacillus TaxID=185978 RepID=UPI0036315486
MKKSNQKAAIAALSALIIGSAIIPFNVQAAPQTGAVSVQAAATSLKVNYEAAIKHLINKGVLQGYPSGEMKAEKPVTNAEFIKMVLLALEVDQPAAAPGAKWYESYLAAAAAKGLIASSDALQPNAMAAPADMAAIIAKALQRDTKSVQYWMEQQAIGSGNVTRGETAGLLVKSEAAIRSSDAKIVSIKSLNNISFEVVFDAPMTIEDETMATASANFAFDGGIKLVNQPRLKTGSTSTYIVPVQTMTQGTEYTLNYKGKQKVTAAASGETMKLNEARQVTADTFEIDSFRSDGVIDYGYLISAYAGGRGANAAVLDENNQLNGKTMQIIPSLATRQATLTPEGGGPITVSYVGFTQSTDGKQEPKFRLPQGQTLQPGVKYTVTSNWFEVKQGSFVAKEIAPLALSSVEAVNETTLNVSLAADPGDELFAYRSVQLKGSDGTTLTAQYKVQTRKGVLGVFEVQNGGKLQPGVSYDVTPVGTWATSKDLRVVFN